MHAHLLDNACKFTSNGFVRVTLDCACDAKLDTSIDADREDAESVDTSGQRCMQKLVLEVVDTGMGMMPDEVAHLNETFEVREFERRRSGLGRTRS